MGCASSTVPVTVTVTRPTLSPKQRDEALKAATIHSRTEERRKTRRSRVIKTAGISVAASVAATALIVGTGGVAAVAAAEAVAISTTPLLLATGLVAGR